VHLVLLAALGLLAAPGAAAPAPPASRSLELEVPKNDGWVTDLAGLLSESEARSLSDLMESYRTGSGHEVALLTIPSLEGDSLEGFSLRVAETWGLGDAEKDEGALLLVSRDDRRMRIEVGYGLEGVLPDAICGRILHDVIAPEFKRQNWYGGIRAGIEAIHAAAGGDYGPIQRTAKGRGRSAGLLVLIPVFLVLFLLGSRGRRRRGGIRHSALPWILMSGLGSGRGGGGFGGGGGGGFGGFSGGGGFGGGGASGGW
jgi:uncharacterized protein